MSQGFPMVIGRGRRREHPNQHCLLLLRVLHNFRLRAPKGTPKRVKWPSVRSGSHGTTTKKKKRGKKPGMRRTYFRSGPLHEGVKWPSVAILLLLRKKLGKKPGMRRTYFRSRWLCHFRLRMRRTYFRTGYLIDVTSGHVTFGHVTSGCSTASLHRK